MPITSTWLRDKGCPPDGLAAFEDAEQHHRSGDLAAADAGYTRAAAMADGPLAAAALLNRGLCAFDMTRFVDAEKLFAQAQSVPEVPATIVVEAATLQGNCLAAQGRFEDALSAYVRASEADPSDAFAWMQRAQCLQQIGRDAEAIEGFDRVIALGPGAVRAMRRKAASQRRLGQSDAALESTLLAYRPQTPNDFLEKAHFLCEGGRWSDAIACAREGLAATPGDPDLSRMEGQCHFELGQIDEALRAFDIYTKANPRDAGVWMQIAHAHWQGQNRPASLEATERALSLDENCRGAAYWKGMLLSADNRHADALPWLERGVDNNLNDALCWLTRGLAETALGQNARAVESLRRVLTLDPPDDARQAAQKTLAVLENSDIQAAVEADPGTRMVERIAPLLADSEYLPFLQRLQARILLQGGSESILCVVGDSLHFERASPDTACNARIEVGPDGRTEVHATGSDETATLYATLTRHGVCGEALPAVPDSERESVIYRALFGFETPHTFWQSSDGRVKILRYPKARKDADAFVTSGLSSIDGGGVHSPPVGMGGRPPAAIKERFAGIGYEIVLYAPTTGPLFPQVMQRAVEQAVTRGTHLFPGQVLDLGSKMSDSDLSGFLLIPPSLIPHYFPVGKGIAYWSLMLGATPPELKEAKKKHPLIVAQMLLDADVEDYTPPRRASVVKGGWF